VGIFIGKIRISPWHMQETFLQGVQTEYEIQQSCYCTGERKNLRESGNIYLKQNITLDHVFVMRV
jgi:hypothetical protein